MSVRLTYLDLFITGMKRAAYKIKCYVTSV